MEDAFFKLVLGPWNAVLVVATWGGLHALKQVWPEFFTTEKSWGHRFLPLYPVWVCTFFATSIPGPWVPQGTPWAQRLVLGIVLGTLAANFEPVAKRLGLSTLLSKKASKNDE